MCGPSFLMSRPSLRALTMTSSATRLATAPVWMPAGWPIVPPPNCSTTSSPRQVEQLVHLAGVDAAGSDGHDLAQGPVLIEEQAVRRFACVRNRGTRRRSPQGHGIALELADRGAGVDMIDTGHAHPFADDAEVDAVVFLARVGAVPARCRCRIMSFLRPSWTWIEWRTSR